MPKVRSTHIAPPLKASAVEIDAYHRLAEGLVKTPIPNADILGQLPLFLTRSSLGHILFLNDLYQKIVNVPGIIMELGVRWGRNLALFHSLRTLYEPYNISRKIVGFDTFSGFPSIHLKDGHGPAVKRGALSVDAGYADVLADLLAAHEQLGPRANECRFSLVKGDVNRTVPRYLTANPETLVALAYFDLDLYEPTMKCLQALRPRLLRGSIIVFDQIGLVDFPGETRAFLESWAAPTARLQRNPHGAYQAYMVME